jgi:hypothetical protein
MCSILNARVAEKVMMYEVVVKKKWIGTDEDGAVYYKDTASILKDGSRIGVPSYSTDHNEAFKLLDLLHGQGWLSEVRFSRPQMKWVAGASLVSNMDDSLLNNTVATHESLPTAICLAALRAKGDSLWVDEYLKEKI